MVFTNLETAFFNNKLLLLINDLFLQITYLNQKQWDYLVVFSSILSVTSRITVFVLNLNHVKFYIFTSQMIKVILFSAQWVLVLDIVVKCAYKDQKSERACVCFEAPAICIHLEPLPCLQVWLSDGCLGQWLMGIFGRAWPSPSPPPG